MLISCNRRLPKNSLKNLKVVLNAFVVLGLCTDSEYLRNLCLRGRCVLFMPKNPLNSYSGLETFQLDNSLSVSLYALWDEGSEGLILIILSQFQMK